MKTPSLVALLLVAGCTNEVVVNIPEPQATPPPPSTPAPPDAPTQEEPGDTTTPPDDPAEPTDPPPPPVDAPCTYPSAGALNGVGSVMPRLVWNDARRADGSAFNFDLEDFHCDDADHNSIVFILSAEWCGNCPTYIQDVAQQASAIESAGGLLVFLDLQTSSYEAPSNARAHDYISGYIGESAGIRVGDGGSDPASLVYNSNIWSAVPGGFVVKKSDMKVVANQEESSFNLDYADIVSGLGGGSTSCNEEVSEPNDSAGTAPVIAPGTFSGGVCNAQADFFHVAIAGSWRVDLDFSHARGDLDIEVVNTNVKSESADDDEVLNHSGHSVIRVYGWDGAQNTYTLTLTEL